MLVRFYAVGREIAGGPAASFAAHTLGDLGDALTAAYGERMGRLVQASTLLIDGTRHRITDDVDLADDTVVDLLPPFAGG